MKRKMQSILTKKVNKQKNTQNLEVSAETGKPLFLSSDAFAKGSIRVCEEQGAARGAALARPAVGMLLCSAYG